MSEYNATYCDPRTGWSESQVDGPRGSRYRAIYRGPSLCLRVWYGGSGAPGVPSLASYAGAMDPVASALLDDSFVACGPPGIIGTMPSEGGIVWKIGPDDTAYTMHTDRTECAPWRSLKPSELPFTATVPSWCRSASPGKCPMPPLF